MNEKMYEMEPIGIILTEASTQTAKCQLYEHAEKGKIKEGMFLLISTIGNRKILARVAKIIPQNEFYIAGDAWTEARRKKQEIPSEVARRYEICELDLLREVPGFKEISIPPYPGDEVYMIDISDLNEIFGLESKEGIIWYGSLLGYKNAPIPLTIEAIPMHIAVFGITGSGKSYDVGALIEKLVKIPAGENINLSIPMIIIDANADYIDYFYYFKKNGNLGACPSVIRYVFPTSPIIRTYDNHVLPIALNLNNLSKRDLAELIVTYYSGGEKNELQIAGIELLIDEMVDRGDITEGDFQSVFIDDDTYYKAKATLSKLSSGRDAPIHSATAAAIRRGLDKFKEIENEYKLLSTEPHIDNDFIDELTKNREIAIIDFSAEGAPGVSLPIKQLVISYLSSILFQRFTFYKIQGEERYLLFIIEEAQNYCPNLSKYDVGYSLAREKLGMIATQGRKFGLSLCLISQRPSFIDPIILSMCNTFFIHRIAPEDVSFVKYVCGGLPSSIERRLTRLELGEVVIVGQMNKAPFPLVIKVPRRELVPEHTAGKTDVLGALRRLAK